MAPNRNLTSISISNTISVTANGFWIMFMPLYFQKIGFATLTVSLIYAVSSALTAGFYFCGGLTSDKFGRKPSALIGKSLGVLGSSFILFSSVFLLSGYFTRFLVLWGFFILWMGSGMRLPAISMMLMESSSSHHKGRNYMIAERVLPSIPPSLSVILGASLFLSNQYHVLFAAGFLGLLLSFLTLLPIQETYNPKGKTETIADHRISKSDTFLIFLIIAFALDGMSAQGVSWYIPIFLGSSNLLLYSFLISISTLVIAGFSLVSGVIVDRYGVGPALIPAWLTLSITVFLFSIAVDPISIIMFYSVWVALDTIDTSVPPVLISNKYPKEQRATVLGSFSMAIRSTLFIGPIISTIALTISPAAPFWIKSISNTIAALLLFVALRRNRDIWNAKREHNLDSVGMFKSESKTSDFKVGVNNSER